jgi:hypothetical protein
VVISGDFAGGDYSGTAVVMEDHSESEIQAAIGTWLASGQVLASVTGPWDQLSLSADPFAGPFFPAATGLLQLTGRRAMA